LAGLRTPCHRRLAGISAPREARAHVCLPHPSNAWAIALSTAAAGCGSLLQVRSDPMTPKVRAAGLLGYLEVARELGIDPYAMLQANAIDPRTIEDVEWMVSARAVVAVLEASAEQSGRDDFGLLIARNRS